MTYIASPAVGREFSWRVNSGTIESGQGSAVIVVVGVQTRSVKVSVENPGCNNLVSVLTDNIRLPPLPTKFDEYGNIRFDDEKARLDNLAIQLQGDPTARAYILCYGQRGGRASEAGRRCDRANDYLVNTRGIDKGRVVTVDAGFKDEFTVQLWVVPARANAPTPSAAPSEPRHTQPSRRRPQRRIRE